MTAAKRTYSIRRDRAFGFRRASYIRRRSCKVGDAATAGELSGIDHAGIERQQPYLASVRGRRDWPEQPGRLCRWAGPARRLRRRGRFAVLDDGQPAKPEPAFLRRRPQRPDLRPVRSEFDRSDIERCDAGPIRRRLRASPPSSPRRRRRCRSIDDAEHRRRSDDGGQSRRRFRRRCSRQRLSRRCRDRNDLAADRHLTEHLGVTPARPVRWSR